MNKLVYFAFVCLLVDGSCGSSWDYQWDPANYWSMKFAVVVARHGSRSPLFNYPNDPYPSYDRHFWTSGPGELTNKGKNESFNLGKKLRNDYDGFLPRIFEEGLVNVSYNSVNRDFESAALIMAGLFPPVGDNVWNPRLNWNPVPMYPRAWDVCQIRHSCAQFKLEADNLITKLDQQSTNRTNLASLKDISTLSGISVTKLSELKNFYDTINCQVHEGYKFPAWANKYKDFLKTYGLLKLQLSYSGSDKIIRMAVGPELIYINDILTNAINDKSNTKLYLEAAHDCTLISLLGAFGIKTPREIEPTAHLVFELRKAPPQYFVQVKFFKNSNSNEFELLNIPGCLGLCSFEMFSKFVKTMEPKTGEMC